MIFKILEDLLLDGKNKIKVLLASMKLLANFKYTFSSPIQRPYIGDLILRIQYIQAAACDP